MSRYHGSTMGLSTPTLVFIYIVATILLVGGGIAFKGWRCTQKGELMEAYEVNYSPFTTGCMVKETEDSPWRDVVL